MGLALWVVLSACLLAPAWRTAASPTQTRSTARANNNVRFCPAEERFNMSSSTACGAKCQDETRTALIDISEMLLQQSGAGWSNDPGATFTTHNCNTRANYCTLIESINSLPGDPDAFTFGAGDLQQRLPSYCCWRGVVCCPFPGTSSFYGSCDPYSVVGVLLAHWPEDLQGTLQSVLGPLAVLDKYGMQRFDVSGNDLTGPIPGGITNLTNIYDLLLTDNCESPVLGLWGGRGRGGARLGSRGWLLSVCMRAMHIVDVWLACVHWYKVCKDSTVVCSCLEPHHVWVFESSCCSDGVASSRHGAAAGW